MNTILNAYRSFGRPEITIRLDILSRWTRRVRGWGQPTNALSTYWPTRFHHIDGWLSHI